MLARALCFSTVVAAMMLQGCASDSPRATGLELTGTVFDEVSKQPIEGAYVIATYSIWIHGAHDRPDRCVKTKGMYTGVDGRFRFPVEKLDGLSPGPVPSAFKSGYFRGRVTLPDDSLWQKQSAEAYAGHDLYLKRQDPSSPTFLYSSGTEESCHYAKTKNDAAASLDFLRLKLPELQRLGAPSQMIAGTRDAMMRLESLPGGEVKDLKNK